MNQYIQRALSVQESIPHYRCMLFEWAIILRVWWERNFESLAKEWVSLDQNWLKLELIWSHEDATVWILLVGDSASGNLL